MLQATKICFFLHSNTSFNEAIRVNPHFGVEQNVEIPKLVQIQDQSYLSELIISPENRISVGPNPARRYRPAVLKLDQSDIHKHLKISRWKMPDMNSASSSAYMQGR
jgi:hypothetical protein